MCGFTGFLTSAGCVDRSEGQNLLRRMADSIAHRGPDSDGYWSDPEAGVALAGAAFSVAQIAI